MELIERPLLEEMKGLVSDEDRDEMAIPSYLHPNPLLRWMAWRRVRVLANLTEQYVRNGDKVMDYGCGTGILFDVLTKRAAHLYGVDLVLEPSSLLVQRREYKNVTLLTPEDASKNIEPGSLDSIVAGEVLEHCEPVEPVLEFFSRVLKPGGRLLVTLPTENAAYRFGRRLAGFDGHYHHQNADVVDTAIIRHGFNRLEQRSIPLPGPARIYFAAVYSWDKGSSS